MTLILAPSSMPSTTSVPMGNDLMDLLGSSPLNSQMNGDSGIFPCNYQKRNLQKEFLIGINIISTQKHEKNWHNKTFILLINIIISPEVERESSYISKDLMLIVMVTKPNNCVTCMAELTYIDFLSDFNKIYMETYF